MAETHRTELLIIGAGPAGYTAAIYGARAMLKPLVVAGIQPGGQLTITTEVENYPGFAEIQGPELMEKMQAHAEAFGTRVVHDIIVKVDFTSRPFRALGDGGDVYLADAVVVATGAQARWLGLESEERFKGFGVSACATCDGFFFRDREVVVVGGGNTAVEEALFLTKFASKVTLIHRRDALRAEKILQNRLFANPKITPLWDHVVDEILGAAPDGDAAPGVKAVRARNVKTGEMSEIPADGVFIAIGHAPATELFKGALEMDGGGYLITRPDSTATDVPGVFAAGDVKDHTYRQAVTAAGMGCMAALEAERFLAEMADQATAAAAE